MIALKKKSTRQLIHTFSDFGKYRGREVVVSVKPPDMIEFRIKGTQVTFEMPLIHALRLAEMFHTHNTYRERLAEYQAKKKAGIKRLRRPKKSKFPYAKIYYDVFK